MSATVFKKIRHDFRLTQQEMAEKLGVSKAAISLIEGGKNKPSIDLLKKVCQEFKIEISELINDKPVDRDYSAPVNPSGQVAEGVGEYKGGPKIDVRMKRIEDTLSNHETRIRATESEIILLQRDVINSLKNPRAMPREELESYIKEQVKGVFGDIHNPKLIKRNK